MKKKLLLIATFAVAMLLPSQAKAETSPGYFDGDGSTRYMKIPNDAAFNIAAGGVRTISLKVKVNAKGDYGFFENRVRDMTSGSDMVSGTTIYTSSSYTSVNTNFPTGGWVSNAVNRTSNIYTSDGWVYLCYVLSSGTPRLYYKSEIGTMTYYTSTASRNTEVAIPSYCDPLIGARYQMTNGETFSSEKLNAFANAMIDDVRIYDAELTEDQVQLDYLSAEPLEGITLIAAYDFDNIDGVTVSDISGNGHDGTLVGFGDGYTPAYAITLAEADASKGSFEVRNGDVAIASGDNIEAGTELKVVPSPERGYKVAAVKVNGEEITANDAGEYVFTVSAASEVSVEFTEVTYEQVDQNISTSANYNRYISTITLNDGANSGTVTSTDQSYYRKVYFDKTDTVVKLFKGRDVNVSVTGYGEWIHEYLWIDYNGDGVFTPVFNDDRTAVAEGSELVTYNLYSPDGSNYYNSVGWKNTASNPGHAMITGPDPALPAFQIPSDMPDGTYRARFMLAWNTIDATGNVTGDGNTMASNRGEIIDFTIEVSTLRRSISVVSADDTMGSVAISGTDQTTVYGEDAVEVVATAIDPAKFYNWTNAAGDVVSTEATFSYNSDADDTLTANFGYELTVNAVGATVTLANEAGDPLEAGVLPKGTTVVVTVTPDEDVLFDSFAVNGEDAELTEESTYTLTIDGPTEVAAIYNPKWNHYDGTVAADATRYVTEVTISDERGDTVTLEGPGAGSRPVFKDQLDKTLETAQGETLTFDVTGAGDAIQTYLYIDYDNDGIFTADLDASGAVTAESELVAFNGYSADGISWTNSLGEAADGNEAVVDHNLPTFAIPAELPAGTYRARYKVDYNSLDAYGNVGTEDDDTYNIANYGGAIIDFYIKVLGADRNITVKSSNEQYGIAYISTKETKSVSTGKPVTVIAIPTAPAVFMGWTNEDGDLVTEEPVYDYNGIYDITLTANYGFELTYSATEGGTLSLVNEDNEEVESGEVWFGDTTAMFTATPDEGYEATLSVNGYEAKFNDAGEYDIVMNNKYDVKVMFVEASSVANIAIDAASDDYEYFNLNGMRIKAENLTPGLYIRRAGSRAEKVIIK